MPFPVRQSSDEALGQGLALLGHAHRPGIDVDQLLLAVPPRWRHWATQRRAVAAYLHARRRVPAYRQFLREHDGMSPNLFAHIPVMDHDNYLLRHRVETTLLGGQFPWHGAVLDRQPELRRVRGPVEHASTQQAFQRQAKAAFGNDGFVLVNALPPGALANELNVSMSTATGCVLQSTGPDVKSIVEAFEQLGPGYRYLVVASPSLLKALADAAVDWSQIHVCAIANEGFDESLRVQLKRFFRRTLALFGAADLDLNIGVETEFSIWLRQSIVAKPELGRALFSARALPMIYQYNPFNHYIENGEDGTLLFTLNRLKSLAPRIRYDLKEQGMVAAASDIEALCRDFGVVAPRRSALPLLFHWPRLQAELINP